MPPNPPGVVLQTLSGHLLRLAGKKDRTDFFRVELRLAVLRELGVQRGKVCSH
jgi:hypothetical protein